LCFAAFQGALRHRFKAGNTGFVCPANAAAGFAADYQFQRATDSRLNLA
jgi:hypothetical protein